MGEDLENEEKIGFVTLEVFRLFDAHMAGLSPADVLDACSEDTAHFIPLVDDECIAEWVIDIPGFQSPFFRPICILEPCVPKTGQSGVGFGSSGAGGMVRQGSVYSSGTVPLGL